MKKLNSNLIGLSGKLNSGKDFSAKIIQYHVARDRKMIDKNMDIFEFINFDEKRRYKLSQFETRAFARKLKEMIALLLGVPLSQLEDRDFKNTVIKELNCTPRELLQSLGTGWGRDTIDKSIWCKMTLRDFKLLSTTPNLFPGEPNLDVYPNWLITDPRFENEVYEIEARGFIIRISRDERYRFPELWKRYQSFPSLLWETFILQEAPEQHTSIFHPSETSLDKYQDFKYWVEWEDDPWVLIEELKLILKDEGII